VPTGGKDQPGSSADHRVDHAAMTLQPVHPHPGAFVVPASTITLRDAGSAVPDLTPHPGTPGEARSGTAPPVTAQAGTTNAKVKVKVKARSRSRAGIVGLRPPAPRSARQHTGTASSHASEEHEPGRAETTAQPAATPARNTNQDGPKPRHRQQPKRTRNTSKDTPNARHSHETGVEQHTSDPNPVAHIW
jgi:hypothetical protein